MTKSVRPPGIYSPRFPQYRKGEYELSEYVEVTETGDVRFVEERRVCIPYFLGFAFERQFHPILDDKGNFIPAPEDWDTWKPDHYEGVRVPDPIKVSTYKRVNITW